MAAHSSGFGSESFSALKSSGRWSMTSAIASMQACRSAAVSAGVVVAVDASAPCLSEGDAGGLSAVPHAVRARRRLAVAAMGVMRIGSACRAHGPCGGAVFVL
ncbi:hypothetical protein CP979_35945 [Streptomyces filamentosus]|nr:hypothetical protein CP979_35945 [Streptomyces filamentosus]